MREDWENKYDAPEGYVYVCLACGKFSNNQVRVGDEACFLNSNLYKEDQLIYTSDRSRVWRIKDETEEATRDVEKEE